MWPRVVEVGLGFWLIISPFLLGHPTDRIGWWLTDLVSGMVLAGLALASMGPRYPRAHLCSVAVGAWLIGFGYFAGPARNPPALQNDLLTGLVVLMIAVLPTRVFEPPASWKPFLS